MKIFQLNPIHKLCLSIALIGTTLFGQSAWACEIPNVNGYDYVDCLIEGLATVRQNGKYGFIDKEGNVVIPLQYDDVSFLGVF